MSTFNFVSSTMIKTPKLWIKGNDIIRVIVPKINARLDMLPYGNVTLYGVEGEMYIFDDFGDLQIDQHSMLPKAVEWCASGNKMAATVISMDDFGDTWWLSCSGDDMWVSHCNKMEAPSEVRIPMELEIPREAGWEKLAKHELLHTGNMMCVRWLKLFGFAHSGVTEDELLEHELSAEEVCAESFPISMGSLIARRRWLTGGYSTVGLVYDSSSKVRVAFGQDCDSYWNDDEQRLETSDGLEPFTGPNALEEAWNSIPLTERWSAWYTECFISPLPKAAILYGPPNGHEELLSALDGWGIPVHQILPEV